MAEDIVIRAQRHRHIKRWSWASHVALLLFLIVGGSWYWVYGVTCRGDGGIRQYDDGFDRLCTMGFYGGSLFALPSWLALFAIAVLLWKMGSEIEATEAWEKRFILKHAGRIRRGFENLDRGHHVHAIRSVVNPLHTLILMAAASLFTTELTKLEGVAWLLLFGGLMLLEGAGWFVWQDYRDAGEGDAPDGGNPVAPPRAQGLGTPLPDERRGVPGGIKAQLDIVGRRLQNVKCEIDLLYELVEAHENGVSPITPFEAEFVFHDLRRLRDLFRIVSEEYERYAKGSNGAGNWTAHPMGHFEPDLSSVEDGIEYLKFIWRRAVDANRKMP